MADKEPKKQGWIYKTAANLKQELGMTRRGYEKVRRILLQNGLVQYRRGGIHGKMHWHINREVLLAKICGLRGIPVPSAHSRHHFDRDNFRLPKFIPLDLWHAYLDMRAEAGKPAGHKAKKTAVKQLAELHNQKFDLRPIMEASILKGWLSFFPPTRKQNDRPSESDLKAQEERTKRELAAAAAERAKQPKPPPDKPDKGGGREAMAEIMKKLGIKKSAQ